jgi:pimeloyl-ACP methyl ester carboxylesterase
MLLALGLTVPAPARSEGAKKPELPIPPAATVLTLTGLNFNLTNYMPRQFGGIFARPPYVMRQVRYPASLASNSISTGVEALDAALRATAGPLIVLAHSQGAQVVSHWLRQHADDPAAPSPDRLSFILTGNPLRAEGGHIIGRREVGGTTGAPTPVSPRWKVIDVARRYDGWADWPADETNRLAVRNAKAGMLILHPHYDAIALEDPSHAVWKRGTTTFVLTREAPPLRQRGTADPSVLQAQIEAAYRRPH